MQDAAVVMLSAVLGTQRCAQHDKTEISCFASAIPGEMLCNRRKVVVVVVVVVGTRQRRVRTNSVSEARTGHAGGVSLRVLAQQVC